jgi:transcriptional regulator with XRE-family HTH domain
MRLEKQQLQKKIGESLREMRKTRSLTIEEVAFQSGIETAHIGRIERGDVNPTIFQLYRILEVLGEPFSKLLNEIK